MIKKIESPDLQLAALTPAQHRAAALLACGDRAKDIAKVVGVAEETICRWRRMPKFEARVNQYLKENIEAIKAGLFSLGAEAISVIRELMSSKAEAIRLRAAQTAIQTLGLRFDPTSADLNPQTDPAAIAEMREMNARINESVRKYLP